MRTLILSVDKRIIFKLVDNDNDTTTTLDEWHVPASYPMGKFQTVELSQEEIDIIVKVLINTKE
jgi:hypothetical protein